MGAQKRVRCQLTYLVLCRLTVLCDSRYGGVLMPLCFLSGLEIPRRKYSLEHLAPRHFLPKELYTLPANLVPSIKIFNYVKADRFLCEWETQKYDLCYHAYLNWNIHQSDRKLLRQALNGMPKINPCEYCICSIYKDYCIKRR